MAAAAQWSCMDLRQCARLVKTNGKLPVLGYWGYDLIRELAEARLAGAA
jgi:hypothetical protein